MKYTVEEIKGMSDEDLEFFILDLVTDGQATKAQQEINQRKHIYAFDVSCPSVIVPKYCSDWSVTGPLMVEYGVGLVPYKDGHIAVADCDWFEPQIGRGEVMYPNIESDNDNPLRAVLEVILMIGDKP